MAPSPRPRPLRRKRCLPRTLIPVASPRGCQWTDVPGALDGAPLARHRPCRRSHPPWSWPPSCCRPRPMRPTPRWRCSARLTPPEAGDAPSVDPAAGENPFTRYGDLSVVADIVARRMDSDAEQAALKAEGVSGYEVVANRLQRGPLVEVTGTGPNPAAAIRLGRGRGRRVRDRPDGDAGIRGRRSRLLHHQGPSNRRRPRPPRWAAPCGPPSPHWPSGGWAPSG